jgi:hypothetical protein
MAALTAEEIAVLREMIAEREKALQEMDLKIKFWKDKHGNLLGLKEGEIPTVEAEPIG